jgi:uncharacterized membrane protein
VKAEHGTAFKKAFGWGAVLMLGMAYSVLVHRAAASATPNSLHALVAIMPLAGATFAMAWRSSRRTVMLALYFAACFGLYAMRHWLVAHYSWVFLLEHAGVHALLCTVFGTTLRAGRTPMVTRFARIVHGTLSPALLVYTRSVTWAWTLYFGGISGLSLLLFLFAPVGIWSVFANLLGIPLLALMFIGEYAVRCHVLPPEDRAGPLEAIRAYRQASSNGTAGRP